MDMLTPIEAVRIIKGMTTHCFLLESAQTMGPRGRYSFIGYDPELEITCTDHEATIKSKTAHTVKTPHPAEIYPKNIKRKQSAGHRWDAPSLQAGLQDILPMIISDMRSRNLN